VLDCAVGFSVQKFIVLLDFPHYAQRVCLWKVAIFDNEDFPQENQLGKNATVIYLS